MTRRTIFVIVVLFTGCAALLYFTEAYPGWSLKGMDCVNAYSRARTSVDSAIVDRQRARVVTDKMPGSLRCGDLRRARALPGQAASREQPDVR